MSAHLLVSGRLFTKPELRRSKNGRDFATATIVDREGEAGASRFFRVVVFDDAAIAELARLEDGDACSASGTFALETYESRDGERRTTLKIIADRIISAKPQPKKRASRDGSAAGAARGALTRSPQAPSEASSFFDDSIPF